MNTPIHVGIIGFSLHEQDTFIRIFEASSEYPRCYQLKDVTKNEAVDLLIVKTATESALKKLHSYEENHDKVPVVSAGKSAVEGFDYHIQGVLIVSRVLKVLDAIPISPKLSRENQLVNDLSNDGNDNINIGGQYDILVVSSAKEMRNTLKQVLRKSDIPLNIDFVSNETFAIANIKKKYYDFLFVDGKVSNFAEIDQSISASRKEGVRSSVVMPMAEESVVDDAYIVLRVLKAFADADDLSVREEEVPNVVKKPPEVIQAAQLSAPVYSVLVVDDSELMHKSVKMELDKSNIGLQVDFAFSGEEALEKITQKHYHFVFLDVMMDGIDGFETCSRIRKVKNMNKVPIIMLTSKKSPLDEVRGIVAGCNTYLIKPIKSDEFQKLLLRIVRWVTDFKPAA